MGNHKLLINGLGFALLAEDNDSKSFLSVLILIVRCILYPGCQLFVTSGGKQQSAEIVMSKVQELCNLVPSFRKEIDFRRGRTQEGKDKCRYVFYNGSYFDNLAAKETSRGQRRHAGLIEECVGVDGDILNQVLIPTMNVDRRCMDGSVQENEVLNKSQIYITTAGWKNSFPYRKLITLLVRMIIDPGKAIVMGGTWRIPVLVGLQSKNFVHELQQDETFNEIAFNREYESYWAGTVEGAFFNGDSFDRCRKTEYAEDGYQIRAGSKAYYILSADVGRINCPTIVCVFKVLPQAQGPAVKSLVNMYELDNWHFEDQAIFIKQKFYAFKARTVIIDGNGLGHGLIDCMVKSQVDPNTDESLPDFGIENDPDGVYKHFETSLTEHNAVYIIKANAPINTEAHSNVATQLRSGRLRFLIDEKNAKDRLLATKKGMQMSPEERGAYLQPYQLTSLLREEMLNLKQENEGVNIILRQTNKSMLKDKFSALEYGLWYIYQNEKKGHRRSRKFSEYMFLG